MATNYLKEIRKRKGIGQAELAKEIGVNSRTLWLFETGQNIPGNDIIDKITKTLGISREFLMTGKDKKNGTELLDFDKKIMQTAIKLTHDFFDIHELSNEFIIKISTELYIILKQYKNKKKSKRLNNFLEELWEDYTKGLAVKCFLKTFEPTYNPYDKEK